MVERVEDNSANIYDNAWAYCGKVSLETFRDWNREERDKDSAIDESFESSFFFKDDNVFLIVTRLILEITGRKFNKRVGRGEKGITVYRYISVTDLSIESRENETEIF